MIATEFNFHICNTLHSKTVDYKKHKLLTEESTQNGLKDGRFTDDLYWHYKQNVLW